METETIVNEPVTPYGLKSWFPTGLPLNVNSIMIRIDESSMYVKPSSLDIEFFKAPYQKPKISALRGKMEKLKEELIDKRLEELRSEWKGNF
ncbi:hypothetical protein [Cecembia rubra]|uniref:Uncharacterized protein n=1 Tax=Cecembia rubra TaxID=1485585 RepID=A0A2P8ED39_9BACT|nr:hypothetical protein [Cecembia rubra]PSL07347.1 hypothetical protein CLV48_101277 [Cecembia rubra]